MNVLMIGHDKAFLKKKEKSPSNTINRHELISRGVDKLFVVILVPNRKYKEFHHSNNIIAFQVPFKGYFSIPMAYKICSAICDKNQIDVVSTQSPFFPGVLGYLLKKRKNIPLNIQVHGDFINNSWWIKQSKTHHFWNKWAKWVLKKSDTIRTVNPLIKEQFIELGIDKNKIINFPVFINLNDFQNFDKNFRYKFKDFKNIILFVGFLIPRKGVDTLIKSMPIILKKHPKTLFLIVGNGPEIDNLEKLAIELNVNKNIIFLGEIPHKNISDYFNSCDILVLPSRSESWGRVVLESMIFEKPVIVSNACKISNIIIKNGAGLIFEVENPKSLSEKISIIIDNKNEARKMGKKGKQLVVEKYSESSIIPKYSEMWKKTVGDEIQ